MTLNKHIRKKIAYVPQTAFANWDFPATVFDIVCMGRFVHKRFFSTLTSRDKDICHNAIDTLGLKNYSKSMITELSGGQCQRVFLARALSQQADIYILDEPFKGIDRTTEKIIISILKKLRDSGKTIICVHHDIATAKDYFDHIAIINKKLIAYGKTSLTLTEKNLALAF